VLTLGLMLSEGIKVSKAKAEIKPKPKTLLLVRTKKKICENIKYLRAITKMKSRKMKAINPCVGSQVWMAVL